MSTSLLQLPPELLLPILALLPNRSLLKFSQCSSYARSLAHSSLHTINLEFYPPPYSKDFYLSRHPVIPIEAPAHFNPSSIKCLDGKHTCSSDGVKDTRHVNSDKHPHKTIIRVNEAIKYDYGTILNFQSALVSNILARHGSAIRNIDITVWSFTVPIAETIRRLHGLRQLSIKVQDCYYARSSQRKYAHEQSAAWEVLSSSGGGNLKTLSIENAEIEEPNLFKLLASNSTCRELRLKGCSAVGEALWDFLGSTWPGWSMLRVLAVGGCGGDLNEAALKAIGNMKQLQHLDLYKCVGLDAAIIMEWNEKVWHIPEIIPPRTCTGSAGDVLEVDSDYENGDED